MGHVRRALYGARREHSLSRMLTSWLMVALLLCASAGRAGARAPRTCKSTGVRAIAADTRERLYVDRRDNYYACLRSRNRPVRLAEETVDVYSPLVTSPYAALATKSISP